jgi:hypothetical protein
MTHRTLVVGLLAGCLTLAAPAAAAAHGGQPQGVAVLNFTRFQPVAQDVVVPAGQTARFPVGADNYGRVSLLVSGSTTPGAGPLAIGTLYGPPLVPSGPPRPLGVDANGNVATAHVEPVLGPAMVIVVVNNSTANATLTLSAYLAN